MPLDNKRRNIIKSKLANFPEDGTQFWLRRQDDDPTCSRDISISVAELRTLIESDEQAASAELWERQALASQEKYTPEGLAENEEFERDIDRVSKPSIPLPPGVRQLADGSYTAELPTTSQRPSTSPEKPTIPARNQPEGEIEDSGK